MTSKFSQHNNTFALHDSRALVVHNALPAAVYVVRINNDGIFYLEQTEPFSLPKKLYGSVDRDSERVLNSFQARTSSTGMLLTGERGSGKTMLAKAIAIRAAAQFGMPTVLVNHPFTGDNFNNFIQNISQDAIVMFDEFEKVYDNDDQEKILTLLDGTVRTKKLFIFTSNDKYRVNIHMQNRPGRIFYLKDYKGLDEAFIEEYCTDNLKPELQKHIPMIRQYTLTFHVFNFDMLQALVEEMNRYNESPQESLELLNARPGYGGGDEVVYLANITINGKLCIVDGEWSGRPLTVASTHFQFPYWEAADGTVAEEYHDLPPVIKSEKEPTRRYSTFSMTDMLSIDKVGTMAFKNKYGHTMLLSRAPEKVFNAMDYMV